jgi:hypothetical protein
VALELVILGAKRELHSRLEQCFQGIGWPSVPVPLSNYIADQLKDSATSALAAALIIGARHPEILQSVARVVGDEASYACAEDEAGLQPRRQKANGAARWLAHKTNGHRKPRSDDHRLEKREADEQALLAAMKADPDGAINDWARAIAKSRTSCVSALHRLRDAGLAESVEGKWRLVEEPAPRGPPPPWTGPLCCGRSRLREGA